MVYFNDLDLSVRVMIQFADDTTIVRVFNNPEESRGLQEDISGLVRWAEKWHMEFDLEQ